MSLKWTAYCMGVPACMFGFAAQYKPERRTKDVYVRGARAGLFWPIHLFVAACEATMDDRQAVFYSVFGVFAPKIHVQDATYPRWVHEMKDA